MRRVTSALYVDFDNVFLGLSQLDERTAEAFANDPGRLLSHLSKGRDDEGEFRRRFLVRDCYINPQIFGKYRAQFVAAGFRVVDCPSLTQRGKSAADTHIVIDVVDAISHSTRYEEFVICSADADFSPLMTKLRRHDRRTLMIAAGNAATAYQAVCDVTMGGMEIVAAYSGDAPKPDVAETTEELHAPAPAIARPSLSEEDLRAAIEAVRARVAASEAAVPGSAAAGAAMQAFPGIAASGWAGTGGFGPFVRRHLPELEYRSTPTGVLVLDPERHVEAEPAETEAADDLRARVARVTKVPLLTTEQYAVLFGALARVAKQQPLLGRIGYDVRELAAGSAAPVARTSVNFVVQGLVYAGSDPRTANLDARGLAEKWRDTVIYRCDQAGLELDEHERDELSVWILGGLPVQGAS